VEATELYDIADTLFH